MDIFLSLVIPAYNEARRLPPHLAAVRACFDRDHPHRYEVLVVDDGSSDGLPEILEQAARDWPQLSCIRHPANRGKGAAVRTGMLAARGRLLLFADADDATPIDQYRKLAAAIEAGADLAIGSRYLAAVGATRRRTWSRGLAGSLFAVVARRLLRLTVRDPQCGFKMFRREAARQLFSRGKESGYLFDLELLVLAGELGYQTAEVAVNWADVPGGHLSLVRDSWKVLPGLWRLRRRG